MTTKTNDSSSQGFPQGDNAGLPAPQSGQPEHQGSRNRNQVFKSGPLFISSKGIGWTSWKKRWFILTRTSLVFFRSDPSAVPQKGGEMNLTLGGIDLNNSASVEVKVDKKLLTVFFPDGRDGRAFTLKAETLEDLYEWKTALENALSQAPSTTHPVGQNGILKTEQTDVANGPSDQQKDRQPVKSMVIGRPILLALEDIDGSPSFLEKALRFVEDHGVRVEGILRQAADVDEVHRRVREYEQGKTEFSPGEDAHVIADCIKYILRELPSSPVPASCCNALLKAIRDRNNKLNAMRTAILETFPEPNRKLLQRILQMMQHVASSKDTRMNVSGVAACMSPLLLRPLLAGDCELENTHMDVAGDGSFQLLQAAAAANQAQAIIITLLEEYENIFGEGSMSPELFSNSDESGSESEDATDDDDMYEEDEEEEEDDYSEDDDHEEGSDDQDGETDDEYEHSVTETCSDSGDHGESDPYDDKQSVRSSSFSKSPERVHNHLAKPRQSSSSPRGPAPKNENVQNWTDDTMKQKDISVVEIDDSRISQRDYSPETNSVNESAGSTAALGSQISATKFLGPSQVRRPRWGRTSAKKNLSMESIDFSLEDDEDEIERLEAEKIELQNRISEEVDGNGKLQASLKRRKEALHERRLALERDVARLQEQLQKEKDLRAALEYGSNVSNMHGSSGIDEKTRIELEEIALVEENFNNLKQRLDDLGAQINHQRDKNATVMQDRCIKIEETSSQGTMSLNNKDKEIKDTPHLVERSCRNEGQQNYHTDGVNRDNDHKDETSSVSNKNQSQPNDTSRSGNSKFGWFPGNSPSPLEALAPKSNSSSTSRKSGKGEGSNSTTSALSKLTTRLNFLKERRNQIASELQYIDKGGRGSSNQTIPSPGKSKVPEPIHVVHNIGKNQTPEGGFVQNQEDHHHQQQPSQYGSVSYEDGNRKGDNKDSNRRGDNNNKDTNRKGDNRDGNKKGSSSKSENQSNQHLDRVKSEGQSSSKGSEKGRPQDGQHNNNNNNNNTSRTLSR